MSTLSFERMVGDEEKLATQLEQEFSPLDGTVVRALLHDYDYTQPVQLSILRETLSVLRADAVSEENNILFDRSGTSGLADNSGWNRSLTAEPSAIEGNASLSSDTDTTSISNTLSSVSLESKTGSDSSIGSNNILDDLDKLSNPDKVARLADFFPNAKTGDIAYYLSKSNNNFMRTVDILLNLSFIDEGNAQEKAPTRGIDAFAAEHIIPPGRSSKKSKNKKIRSLEEVSRSTSTTSVNKWEVANADILFIASRTHQSESTISSIYHKNGASKQKTIVALVEQNIDKKDQASDNYTLQMAAIDLHDEFPILSFLQAAALLRLTQQSTAKAHELAKALAEVITSPKQLESIIPQYAPIKLFDPPSQSPRSSSPATPAFAGSSAQLEADRNIHFTKASTYYRKAKSDHLMGGAAAYYASEGREANVAMRKASAEEADAFVASQSSPTSLDLHGVSVKDATRIASEKVRRWWHDLGEGRIGNSRKGGYTIITGLGVHSSDGVAKVGPAVARMLMREGWKYQVDHGTVTVIGVAKKK